MKYLKSLCVRCENGDYDDQFLGQKLPRTGGPESVIDDFDEHTFVNIFEDRPQTTLKRAREIICGDHYNAIYKLICAVIEEAKDIEKSHGESPLPEVPD